MFSQMLCSYLRQCKQNQYVHAAVDIHLSVGKMLGVRAAVSKSMLKAEKCAVLGDGCSLLMSAADLQGPDFAEGHRSYEKCDVMADCFSAPLT